MVYFQRIENKGPPFVSKFFTNLFLLEIKNLTTTAYHMQKNGQAKSYNRNIVTRENLYVSEDQKAWDTYVQPQTYAYNTETYAAMGSTPFNFILSREARFARWLCVLSLFL